MSKQLEQVKALIELREKARLGGGQKESTLSTKKVNSQLAKESRCFLTKGASRNSICS